MENNKTYRHHPVDPDSYTVVERGVADLYIPNEDTQPVIRAIGVSHTACKDEFRQNLRSHSWSVFSFFILRNVSVRNNVPKNVFHVGIFPVLSKPPNLPGEALFKVKY